MGRDGRHDRKNRLERGFGYGNAKEGGKAKEGWKEGWKEGMAGEAMAKAGAVRP